MCSANGVCRTFALALAPGLRYPALTHGAINLPPLRGWLNSWPQWPTEKFPQREEVADLLPESLTDNSAPCVVYFDLYWNVILVSSSNTRGRTNR